MSDWCIAARSRSSGVRPQPSRRCRSAPCARSSCTIAKVAGVAAAAAACSGVAPSSAEAALTAPGNRRRRAASSSVLPRAAASSSRSSPWVWLSGARNRWCGGGELPPPPPCCSAIILPHGLSGMRSNGDARGVRARAPRAHRNGAWRAGRVCCSLGSRFAACGKKGRKGGGQTKRVALGNYLSGTPDVYLQRRERMRGGGGKRGRRRRRACKHTSACSLGWCWCGRGRAGRVLRRGERQAAAGGAGEKASRRGRGVSAGKRPTLRRQGTPRWRAAGRSIGQSAPASESARGGSASRGVGDVPAHSEGKSGPARTRARTPQKDMASQRDSVAASARAQKKFLRRGAAGAFSLSSSFLYIVVARFGTSMASPSSGADRADRARARDTTEIAAGGGGGPKKQALEKTTTENQTKASARAAKQESGEKAANAKRPLFFVPSRLSPLLHSGSIASESTPS